MTNTETGLRSAAPTAAHAHVPSVRSADEIAHPHAHAQTRERAHLRNAEGALALAQLRRVRWMVRVILLGALVASGWANALAAQDNTASQVIHALPVVALWCAVEIISRVPVVERKHRVLRNLATGAIGLLGAWVSYWHMVAVAYKYGERNGSQYVLAFIIDGLVVVASVSLVALAQHVRTRAQAAQRVEDAHAQTELVAQLRTQLEDAQRAAQRSAQDAAQAQTERDRAHAATQDAQTRAESAQAQIERMRTRRTAQRTASGPRTSENARKEIVRNAATAGASVPEILLNWDAATMGEKPARRTVEEWTKDLRNVTRRGAGA
jgi:hypothetical protein